MADEISQNYLQQKIVAVGFGDYGSNIINILSKNNKANIQLILIDDKINDTANEKISLYSFKEINTIAHGFSETRLWFMFGNLEENFCDYISSFGKNLRENGIMVVALVTLPSPYEQLDEKLTSTLKHLESNIDAILIFPKDDLLEKNDNTLEIPNAMNTISYDMLDCMWAMLSIEGDVVNFDIKDLRSCLHGCVLYGIGRSKDTLVDVTQKAVHEIKQKMEPNANITSILQNFKISDNDIVSDKFGEVSKALDYAVNELLPENGPIFGMGKNIGKNENCVVILAS